MIKLLPELSFEDTCNKEYYKAFYFYDIDECNEFIEELKNQNCNIPWRSPIKLPFNYYRRLSEDVIRSLQLSPKLKAKLNLRWGFELVKHLEEEK